MKITAKTCKEKICALIKADPTFYTNELCIENNPDFESCLNEVSNKGTLKTNWKRVSKKKENNNIVRIFHSNICYTFTSTYTDRDGVERKSPDINAKLNAYVYTNKDDTKILEIKIVREHLQENGKFGMKLSDWQKAIAECKKCHDVVEHDNFKYRCPCLAHNKVKSKVEPSLRDTRTLTDEQKEFLKNKLKESREANRIKK